MPLSFADIVLRLLTAMFISLIVGLERERAHRPAGLRTHMLVSLGACLVMITGILIWNQYAYELGGSFDVNRLGAQVVSGVGFLGAGTIVREGNMIKGLTTAAGLWVCACMGLAAGAGYYHIALLCAGCILLTLMVLDRIPKFLPGMSNYYATQELICEQTALSEAMDALHITSLRYHASVTEFTYYPEGKYYRIAFKVRFTSSQAETHADWFSKEIRSLPCFRSRSNQNTSV